jgi:hypothetical protein
VKATGDNPCAAALPARAANPRTAPESCRPRPLANCLTSAPSIPTHPSQALLGESVTLPASARPTGYGPGADEPPFFACGAPRYRVSCGWANLAPPPDPFGFTVTGGFRSGLPAQPNFGPPPQRDEPGSRLDEAKDFLGQALANGPRQANQLEAGVKEAGINEFTPARARADLCSVQRQRGGRTVWVGALKTGRDEDVA